MAQQQENKKEKKGFWTRFWETLDKKMEEKAKAGGGCCCSGTGKASSGKECH
jgi:hypothetical protein